MVCYYYCHYYYYCCLLQLLSLSWLNLNYFYNLYFGLDWNCFLVYLIVLCLYVCICSWILLQYVFVVPISKISKSHIHTHTHTYNARYICLVWVCIPDVSIRYPLFDMKNSYLLWFQYPLFRTLIEIIKNSFNADDPLLFGPTRG